MRAVIASFLIKQTSLLSLAQRPELEPLFQNQATYVPGTRNDG